MAVERDFGLACLRLARPNRTNLQSLACTFAVLLRDKFRDSRPSEHQGNMNEEDPLVHFNREAEEGLRKIRLSWDGAKDKTCDRSDSSGEEY
jgi:hypothetical protein